MPKVDSKKFVDVYLFWKWEYTRRNKEHDKFFKAILSGKMNLHDYPRKWMGLAYGFEFRFEDFSLKVWRDEDKGYGDVEVRWDSEDLSDCDAMTVQSWRHQYSCLVMGGRIYLKVDSLLRDIVSGKIQYNYPYHGSYLDNVKATTIYDLGYYCLIPYDALSDYERGYCDLPTIQNREDFTLEYYPEGLPAWRESHEQLYPEPSERLVLIDMEQDIEKIVREIRFYHSDYHGREDYEFKERICRDRGTVKRMPKSDLARAIGLWLWDYLDENNSAWEYRAKSYAAFREQYQNPKKPECYIDKYQKDSQLADLLERTRECIEKKEVLPIG